MADDHQAVIAEAERRSEFMQQCADGGLRPSQLAMAATATTLTRCHHALASLTQQLQDAETALRWFADEANYDFDGPDHDSAVQAYGSERARAALAAAGTGEARAKQNAPPANPSNLSP